MCFHSISTIFIPLSILAFLKLSASSIENGNQTLHQLLQNTPACTSSSDKSDLCLFDTNCTKPNTLSDGCMISLYSLKPTQNVTVPQYGEVPVKNDGDDSEQPHLWQAWIYGVLSAVVISFSGVTGYVLSPLITSSYQQHVLNTLIGLSFGSLTSTALLQLIPEAYKLHSLIPDYMKIGMFTVITTWVLYVVQTLSSIILNEQEDVGERNGTHHNHNHSHSHSHSHGHGHGHGHGHKAQNKHIFHQMKNASVNKVSSEECTAVTFGTDQENNHQEVHNANSKMVPFDNQKLYIVSEMEDTPSKTNKEKPTSLAWMIILGDGLHNFLDGVSIGAGYTQSLRIGMSLTLAVACEEYPHELGDFAILIQSGLSIRKAAFYNYLSATSIIFGVAVGIVLGELKYSSLIFSSSAGLFLYIALANLMAELRHMIESALRNHRKHGLLMLFLQNAGFFLGFVVLLYITRANSNF